MVEEEAEVNVEEAVTGLDLGLLLGPHRLRAGSDRQSSSRGERTDRVTERRIGCSIAAPAAPATGVLLPTLLLPPSFAQPLASDPASDAPLSPLPSSPNSGTLSQTRPDDGLLEGERGSVAESPPV